MPKSSNRLCLVEVAPWESGEKKQAHARAKSVIHGTVAISQAKTCKTCNVSTSRRWNWRELARPWVDVSEDTLEDDLLRELPELDRHNGTYAILDQDGMFRYVSLRGYPSVYGVRLWCKTNRHRWVALHELTACKPSRACRLGSSKPAAAVLSQAGERDRAASACISLVALVHDRYDIFVQPQVTRLQHAVVALQMPRFRIAILGSQNGFGMFGMVIWGFPRLTSLLRTHSWFSCLGEPRDATHPEAMASTSGGDGLAEG